MSWMECWFDSSISKMERRFDSCIERRLITRWVEWNIDLMNRLVEWNVDLIIGK